MRAIAPAIRLAGVLAVLAAPGVLAANGCSGGQKGPNMTDTDSRPTPAPGAPTTSPLADQAVAGVADAELAGLLADHWEWTMARSPVWATTLGDHRYDDRLAPNSVDDLARARADNRAFARRGKAIDRGRLDPTDRITLDLFVERRDAEIASEVCEFETWSVSPHHDNPFDRYNRLAEKHRFRDAADGASFLARYRAIAGAVDNELASLERGAAAGRLASAESVRRTIEMADRLLATPVAEWAMLTEPVAKLREALPGAEADRLAGELARVVERDVAPAYRRYRAFLADRVLSRARSGDRVGLHALPDGEACYAARVQFYLGQGRTAEELHQLGLREIARIDEAIRELGERLFGTRDLAEILARLRSDPALHFTSAEEMLAAARAALDAANAAVPRVFGVLPRARCEVTAIPDYQAPYTTIAYYSRPHFDGSKPGEYYVNTYKPETRPRYEFQALSFHEAVPGHHLQIAIAQELGALPASRRLAFQTAYGEGWALYTETLADELGLYSGDLDRMGMLSFDAWRASRLVVDTGIHAMGWTRERAEAFMREHTALAQNNISNEVDRYVAWPGQALAYKVGQLEILRLRQWARDRLGARFSLAGFHDVVLGNGAVSLQVLARQVEQWVAERMRQAEKPA